MTEATSDIKKGLAGVVVDVTSVSKVNPETNSLLYRGYPVQELAEHSWGRIVLWATAIGLFLFGVYCLAEAKYRKHS